MYRGCCDSCNSRSLLLLLACTAHSSIRAGQVTARHARVAAVIAVVVVLIEVLVVVLVLTLRLIVILVWILSLIEFHVLIVVISRSGAIVG